MEDFTLSKRSGAVKRSRGDDTSTQRFTGGPSIADLQLPETPQVQYSSTIATHGSIGQSDEVKLLRGRRIISPKDAKWDFEKDNTLRAITAKESTRDWNVVADALGDPDITAQECKRRWKLILKANRNCGPWTPSEDRELLLLVQEVQRSGQKRHSKHIQWADIAAKMFWRDGKQCRERWCNQLDPEIVHQSWSQEEKRIVLEAQRQLGNKWSQIAKRVPGRTESAVKNLFNTHKRKSQRREPPLPQAPPPPIPNAWTNFTYRDSMIYPGQMMNDQLEFSIHRTATVAYPKVPTDNAAAASRHYDNAYTSSIPEYHTSPLSMLNAAEIEGNASECSDIDGEGGNQPPWL